MTLRISFVLAVALTFGISAVHADPPTSLDLRDYNGSNYVTSIKSQSGGTCWTFGAFAAMESNLLMTGEWSANNEVGQPNLAEYHLDWWNGFNENNNDDISPPYGHGLVVHEGGDYLVTAAYLTRGEGAVRNSDAQSYTYPPARADGSYHYYYPRHIEWHVAKADLSNANAIKEAVMQHGAVGTCMCSSGAYLSGSYVHYQPSGSSAQPNHAIAIIGWDDDKVTQAPQPGAWLCKNSWGSGWGLDGYFWISYYDKWSAQHPEMGAVSFVDVERLRYQHFYYHDYHGWRDTYANADQAFNAFVADGEHMLEAVSFVAAGDDVIYTVRIYDRFEGGQLLDELASVSGTFAHTGFHTVDLDAPLGFSAGDDFYIYLEVSHGGMAYDRSSEIPVLLGASYRVWVDSASSPGQSYYRNGGGNWQDLYDFNNSANFCIKGLASNYRAADIVPTDVPTRFIPGRGTTLTVDVQDLVETHLPGTVEVHYRFDDGAYATLPMSPTQGSSYEATLPSAGCSDAPEFYFSVQTDGGATVFSPVDVPLSTHTAYVGYSVIAMSDDFESDLGWSVVNENLIAGAWERGIPAGDGLRGDPTTDFDGSGACYLTGNGLGDTDVDGGPTRLITPALDMSAPGEYIVSFAHWFATDSIDGDVLKVDISVDDGQNWSAIDQLQPHDGWSVYEFDVADFVTPAAQTRLRFSIEDNPNNSVDELAIDAFSHTALECVYRGDLNCDFIVDFDDINAFVFALTDPLAYEQLYPGCDRNLADIDADGQVGFGDINPFVALLLS